MPWWESTEKYENIYIWIQQCSKTNIAKTSWGKVYAYSAMKPSNQKLASRDMATIIIFYFTLLPKY